MQNVFSYLPESLLLAFLAITFLQSGWDKLIDWKGNLAWLTSHFKESPLHRLVPALLAVLLLFEILTGLLAVWGLVALLGDANSKVATWAAAAACLTLLMLLFGQRVAKDYDGARTIVIYFMPAIFLLYLLT